MRKSIFAIGLLVCGLSLAACQKNSQEEEHDIKRPTFDGDLATGNVNAQMFGVLNLTSSTLSYNVYTVNDDMVKLFDSLDVLKS